MCVFVLVYFLFDRVCLIVHLCSFCLFVCLFVGVCVDWLFVCVVCLWFRLFVLCFERLYVFRWLVCGWFVRVFVYVVFVRHFCV